MRLPLLSLILCAFMTQSANAAVYNVSPSGSDDDPGTAPQPLRTLSKACELAKEGDTIRLAAGTYDETTRCALSSGVTVRGVMMKDEEGAHLKSGSTVITNTEARSEFCNPAVRGEQALLNLSGLKNVTIEDIYFDGNNRNAAQGIYVSNSDDYETVVSNNTLKNLAFENFRHNAVRFHGTNASKLYDSTIINSSSEYAPGQCGSRNGHSRDNVGVSGGSRNVEIKNNYFETDDYYGYGLRGSGTSGTKIINNTFNLYEWQKWKASPDSDQKWENFDIEFFGGHDSNVLIKCNTFDQTISLIVADKTVVKSPYSFKVYSNHFKLDSGYAIEMGSSSMHIIDNYFDFGDNRTHYAMASFGKGRKNVLSDMRITGNILDGVQFQFLQSNSPIKDSLIANNTAIFRDSTEYFFRNFETYFIRPTSLADRDNKNTIVNNMAVNFRGYLEPNTRKIGFGGRVNPDDNLYIDARDADTTVSRVLANVGEPDVVTRGLSTSSMKEKYQLAANSIAIDAGQDVGLPYEGEKPDMGAVEKIEEEISENPEICHQSD